jgi:CelD/BcsL family acetyltransferase involved in cellulose biosynthesis
MTDLSKPAGSVRAEAISLSKIPMALDGAWNDLAEHASEPNPFYESWFLRPAIAHLSEQSDARMVMVWRDTALIGLLPVIGAEKYGRAPIQHIENWLHYHCFYGVPLVRKGYEDEFWNAALALFDSSKWATGFLHLVGLDPQMPVARALAKIRRADIVHKTHRAMLKSDLNSQSYYQTHMRKKKRKEIGRLWTRLHELGSVAFERLSHDADCAPWITDFLDLEASGWKGREGSALGACHRTAAFFREALVGAQRAGKLELVRLTLDGAPIAMLVNFLTAPGGYAFKIAFDEKYARFSPGVLIKVENLKVLDRSDIAWMDSCASENHPMINSLWAERRTIVRATVPLSGIKRQMIFRGARALEGAARILRGMR